MKRFLSSLLPLLMLAYCVYATTLKIGWDPSETSGVTNYTIYAGTNLSKTNYLVRVHVGTNQYAQLDDIKPGAWDFTATAWHDGIESDFAPLLSVVVPEPPPRTYTVILQFGGTVTNFQDVGFFKLRLLP